jgi:hypothetical protein
MEASHQRWQSAASEAYNKTHDMVKQRQTGKPYANDWLRKANTKTGWWISAVMSITSGS